MSKAWWEKNRHTAWNDTTAAIPAPASMPTNGATRGLCDQSGGQQSEQRERARPAKRGPERIQQRTPRLG